MDNYESKLRREKEWHKKSGQRKHILNSRLFYSDERQVFNYSFARNEMARLVEEVMALDAPAPPHPFLSHP